MLLFSHQTEAVDTHDPRMSEILELCAAEGITLKTPVDVILWLEDRGCVVDLRTGEATDATVIELTPAAQAINHLLDDDAWRVAVEDEIARDEWSDLFDYDGEADDLVEARYDEEFWARGC